MKVCWYRHASHTQSGLLSPSRMQIARDHKNNWHSTCQAIRYGWWRPCQKCPARTSSLLSRRWENCIQLRLVKLENLWYTRNYCVTFVLLGTTVKSLKT